MQLYFRYSHHNCNKIFRSILGKSIKSGSNIFTWPGTARSHTTTPIFPDHLQFSILPISAVINVNSLYTYSGHRVNEMERISSNVKNICQLNQESEGKVIISDTPINDSNACSSGISKCDAETVNTESKELGLLAGDSCTDYHSSQSDSDCFGFDLLFDMTKVVDNVKIKVKEKRQKREMLEKVPSPKKPCRKTPRKVNLSCKAKRKEKKLRQRNKYSEKCSSTDQSESDGLGLQSLFEETKSVQTGKKKTKKARKKAKHLAGKKSTANEFLGLELMFSEHNPVLRRSVKFKGKKRKRNLSEKYYDSKEDEDLATELDEQETVTVKKKKPNYFVAIRVSNPKIHLAVTDFQASVLKENAKLKPALIPVPSLHLTMAVMHLDESLVQLAKDTLQKCKIEITQILKCVDFKLNFLGVGNFSHEVVFAKVEEEKYFNCLKSINDVITATFEEEGISVREGKEWKPHLTLLKLSRKPALRKKGIRKVKEDIYASWCDYNFGEELVNNVYLCSMFEPKEQDGFYKCVATISMNDDIDELNQPLEPKD